MINSKPTDWQPSLARQNLCTLVNYHNLIPSMLAHHTDRPTLTQRVGQHRSVPQADRKLGGWGVLLEVRLSQRDFTFVKTVIQGLPWWLSGKESTCQCRRHRFDSWVRKVPWRKKWQPLQYYCLGNPTDRGTRGTTVHGVAKESDTTERVNNNSSLVSLCCYRGVCNILIYNI